MFGKSVGWAILAGLLVTVGCGKADYEAQMQKQVKRLGFASKFLQNLHRDTESIDGVASMRLPTFLSEFDKKELKRGMIERTLPVSSTRIEPPFGKLPGFKKSYEEFVKLEGPNDRLPVYAYFGWVSDEDQKLPAVLGRIKANANKHFRGANFSKVDIETPEPGQTLSVNKMTLKGKQPFDTDPRGGDVKSLAGQCDVYVFSEAGVHVIVAFRGSDLVAKKTNLFQVAEYAIGTLEIDGGGADNS